MESTCPALGYSIHRRALEQRAGQQEPLVTVNHCFSAWLPGASPCNLSCNFVHRPSFVPRWRKRSVLQPWDLDSNTRISLIIRLPFRGRPLPASLAGFRRPPFGWAACRLSALRSSKVDRPQARLVRTRRESMAAGVHDDPPTGRAATRIEPSGAPPGPNIPKTIPPNCFPASVPEGAPTSSECSPESPSAGCRWSWSSRPPPWCPL